MKAIAKPSLVLFSQLTNQVAPAEALILDVQKIVAELRNEMERIGRAIGLLEQSGAEKPRRGRKPGSIASAAPVGRPRQKGLTPAGRKRLSELMKKRWAERRKKQA
ncbi:MAG TPA: hypothetical protein VMT64_05955 [Candidatus Binataceae bacterium]|nr:hypothetical protein [Candidatus Binataceae bacterium]